MRCRECGTVFLALFMPVHLHRARDDLEKSIPSTYQKKEGSGESKAEAVGRVEETEETSMEGLTEQLVEKKVEAEIVKKFAQGDLPKVLADVGCVVERRVGKATSIPPEFHHCINTKEINKLCE